MGIRPDSLSLTLKTEEIRFGEKKGDEKSVKALIVPAVCKSHLPLFLTDQ